MTSLNRTFGGNCRRSLIAGISLLLISGCSATSNSPSPAPSQSLITQSSSPSPSPSISETKTMSPSSSPSPTGRRTPSPSPVVKSKYTNIRIHFSDCDGCRIEVGRIISRMGTAEIFANQTLKSSVISVTVLKSHTRGLAIMVSRNPNGSDAGMARADVVVQYSTVAPGQAVSAHQAASMKKGTYCWAGTASDHVNIYVHTYHWTYTLPGATRLGSTYWASPMLDGLLDSKNVQPTNHGGLGDQDYPYCFIS